MPACEIIPPCGCLCGSCACVSESVHVGVSVGACCFYINSIHVNTNKYLYHFIHFCIMIICSLIYSVKLWSTCESPFSHHPDHYSHQVPPVVGELGTTPSGQDEAKRHALVHVHTEIYSMIIIFIPRAITL